MNNLMNNEITMTSLEVVELINKLRLEENNRKELLHKNLMASIRKEVEVLESLGLNNGLNFKLVEYEDRKGEKRPCYKMNKQGIMQMLNKESAYVRYKTQQYIEALENKLKEQEQPKLPMTYKEALQQLLVQVEENEKLLEQNKILQPKADYTDKVLNPNSEKLLTVTQIAKDLGMSAVALNNKLNKLGVQYRSKNAWYFYAKYQHLVPEYADYVINEYNQTLKWTEKGRQWIIEFLNKANK